MYSCNLTFSLTSVELSVIKEAIGEFSIYASVLQSKLGLMISCQTTLNNRAEPLLTLSDDDSEEIEVIRAPGKTRQSSQNDKRVQFVDPFLGYDPNFYNASGTYEPRKRYD